MSTAQSAVTQETLDASVGDATAGGLLIAFGLASIVVAVPFLWRALPWKRLLAYSTIAHAGYMLMALVPLSAQGNRAMLFYLVAYLLMNLGAFACVAFIRNATGSEDLADMGGLIHRAPWLVVAFAVFLLSLLGLLGLGVLATANETLQGWSQAIGWVGLVFFAAGIGMSVIAASVNWGGVFWAEPRFQATFRVLAVAS